MLRRLVLRDFVIVPALDLELGAGFTVLTGETGAGKSILIDALQLALGGRGDAGVVREGAPRAEISAEFDPAASLAGWLESAGFDAATAGDALLVRRVIDAQGKSRAWINGSPATVAQLREAAEHLVEIHGQHAWQRLTRAAAVRELLDAEAGIDTAPLAAAWSRWRAAADAVEAAASRQAELGRERERLAWQLGEIDKLAPGDDEWETLEADHRRLAHAQALIDGAQAALAWASEGEDNAGALAGRAVDALREVAAHDAALGEVIEVLQGAQAQLQDAAHTLSAYLHRIEPDPAQLAALDERLAAWVGLARRWRVPSAGLPALVAQWRAELQALDAASDSEALQRECAAAERAWRSVAGQVSAARQAAAPRLSGAVTDALQHLGMRGGRFEVALVAADRPQSWGLESAEFRVAGHAGSTPRPLGKVASGGELSRIALAIAVTTSGTRRMKEGGPAGAPVAGEDGTAGAEPLVGTLIFDEVDAGIGGAVAETVGRLLRRLGDQRQVLAVTHLPQVAAAADRHVVVSKSTPAGGGATQSSLEVVEGSARRAEIARMLGGGRVSDTGLAHATEMLAAGHDAGDAAASASASAFPVPDRLSGRRRA